MMKITKLCKKTTLTTSLTLALFSCLTCLANQDIAPDADSGNKSPEQTEATIMKKMSRNEQIAFSKQDLVTRLDLETEAVTVSGATPVSWRSGALGCPKPGMSYTDVLVPGIWIVLRVDKAVYRYHAATGGKPFYCPGDRAEPPVMGSGAD